MSRKALISFLLIVSFAIIVKSQDGANSSQSQTRPRILKEDPIIAAIIKASDFHFKAGEKFLKENNPKMARVEFDNAVDVILASGLDIRDSLSLTSYYYLLIEKIYKFEVPQQSTPSNQDSAVVATGYAGQIDENKAGFNKQEFQVSGDELAQIKLYEDNPTPVVASKSCPAIAPVISGLRLGMTPQQASAAMKRSLKLQQIGDNYTGIDFKGVQVTLNNSRIVILGFYKGRLSHIIVKYRNSIQWSSLIEFTKTISKNLNLPNDWQDNSLYKRHLFCKSFILVAEGISNYSLSIADVKAHEQMEKERTEKLNEKILSNEKKKQAFKP